MSVNPLLLPLIKTVQTLTTVKTLVIMFVPDIFVGSVWNDVINISGPLVIPLLNPSSITDQQQWRRETVGWGGGGYWECELG